MKIVGIGDLLIPGKYIQEGFEPLNHEGNEVVIVDWKLSNYEELQNINLKVEQGGSEVYEPPAEIYAAAEDADILIVQFCTVTKKLIDHCKNLKAIGVLRGGIENVNLEYANEKGILVFNTPGRNANAVADFTVGMLISECRNIAKAHRELKEGHWVRDYSNADYVPDLCDKTAGIIGYGNIGRKVAQRLKGFDMKVIAYDPYVKPETSDVPMVSLEELMKVSDFVTIHSRLTPDTEKMINGELLSLMKPTAYFVNTARSGLVDEDALCEALRNHRIAGAAIDVFEVEPPSKDYKMVVPENVTITPHLAGGTKDAFTHSPVLLAKEMVKVLEDRLVSRSIVNLNMCKENAITKMIG